MPSIFLTFRFSGSKIYPKMGSFGVCSKSVNSLILKLGGIFMPKVTASKPSAATAKKTITSSRSSARSTASSSQKSKPSSTSAPAPAKVDAFVKSSPPAPRVTYSKPASSTPKASSGHFASIASDSKPRRLTTMEDKMMKRELRDATSSDALPADFDPLHPTAEQRREIRKIQRENAKEFSQSPEGHATGTAIGIGAGILLHKAGVPSEIETAAAIGVGFKDYISEKEGKQTIMEKVVEKIDTAFSILGEGFILDDRV